MLRLAVATAAVLSLAAAQPVAEVTVAVAPAMGNATEDNGQHKLARAPDGSLYLVYSAPSTEGGVASSSKYAPASPVAEAVFVARSDDDGATWQVETRLSRRGVAARLAAVAAGPDGRIHAAWVDFEDVGHVWYAVRENGVWSPGAKVSPGPFYAGFPALAVSDDAVHLLWYAAPPDPETRHGSAYKIEHIFDRGDGWSDPVLVSTNSRDALNPAVVRDRNGVVHTAWYQLGLNTYLTHYATWDGERWAVPRPVSPLEGNATGVAMDVGADGVVHLVWEQVTGDTLGVSYSRLAGGSWSEPEVLSEPGGTDPVVATDGDGRVFAVWSRVGVIEARLWDGEWGEVTDLGEGAHPVALPGAEPLLAWTRPAGGGHEIVVGPLGVLDGGSSAVAVGAIVAAVLAVILAIAVAWRRRTA